MDLQIIHEETDTCFDCKLSKLKCNILDSNNPIYGKLLVNHCIKNLGKPKLLLVGIAPSYRRFDPQRRAFEGIIRNNITESKNSGDFFYYVLDKSKLKEFDIYITNLTKCSTELNSEPEEESILACKRLLELEISTIKPYYIIALGNFVKNQLSKIKLEIEVLSLKHPSYYFRFKSEKSAQEELNEFNQLSDYINKNTILLNRWLN